MKNLTCLILLQIFIVLFTSSETWSQHPPFNVNDSLALVALYNSTNGSSWTDNGNWLSDQSPRFWSGVYVTDDYDTRVRKLKLKNNNLTGTLPENLGNLTGCEELVLSDNQISGVIPAGINNMEALERLELQNNLLTSPMPNLPSLNNLTVFSIAANSFEGEIPSEFGNIPNLISLTLDHNNFTGTIPSSFTHLDQLRELYIRNSQLDSFPGDILAGMNNLTALILSNNKIAGPLPESVGNLQKIQMILLDGNQITSIPESINQLSTLTFLNLKNNRLRKIPVIEIPGLATFDVSVNNLIFEDIIPNMNSATQFWYHYQNYFGPELMVMAEIGDVKKLRWGFTEPGNQYQWLKDNVEITGANSNEYILKIVSLEEFGNYTLKVTNPAAPMLTLYTSPMNIPPLYDCHICGITPLEEDKSGIVYNELESDNNWRIKVVKVEGEVELLSPNKDPVELRGGEVLTPADRIYTGMESWVKLCFADNSSVVVQELTDVKIGTFQKRGNAILTQIWLKAGEVDAEVIEESAVKSDFKVRTPTATCSVRGTNFSVKHDSISNVSTFLVSNGIVSVVPENNPADSVLLDPWHKVTVSENGMGNVTPFSLSKIEIIPDTFVVSAKLRKIFGAIGYDTEGNCTSVEANWEAETGAIDSLGYYTADNHNGYYTITATEPVHGLEATAVVQVINGWPVGNNDLPLTGFELEQNYPNPFNETTTITFEIPLKKQVVLKVYNLLGEEVKTILNETREKGRHSVMFSNNEFESGIYFYQLQAGAFVKTKRMMLLK